MGIEHFQGIGGSGENCPWQIARLHLADQTVPQRESPTADGQGTVFGIFLHGKFRLHRLKTADGVGIGEISRHHAAGTVIAAGNGRQRHHCPVVLHAVLEVHQGRVGGIDGKRQVFSHHFRRQSDFLRSKPGDLRRFFRRKLLHIRPICLKPIDMFPDVVMVNPVVMDQLTTQTQRQCTVCSGL